MSKEQHQLQQQQQQQQHQKTSVIRNVEQTVKTPVDVEKPYVCSVCGKSFTSLLSLKGHVAGSGHRGGYSQYIKEGREEKKITIKPKYEGKEISIPDPYAHLKQMLITFGVSEKNSEAIVKYMEPYSVDDIFKLVEACSTYMPRSRLRLFIESWANVRNIPIPQEIEEELGINRGEQYYYRYRRPRYEGEEDLKSTSGVAQLLSGIGNLIKSLQPQTPQPSNTDNSMVSALQEQINTLQSKLDDTTKKLEESEKRRMEEKIKSLESEIQKIREERQGRTTQLDLSLQMLKNLDKKITKALEIMEKFIFHSIEGKPKPERSESPEASRVELPPELYEEE